MIVAVTGAAGRVGTPITRHLVESGYEVRAIDRQYSRDLGVRVDLVDLAEPLAAYRVLDGADALVHLASPSAARITVETFGPAMSMNMSLFQAAADLGLGRIIYASSIRAIAGDRWADEADTRPSCLAYLPLDGQEPTNAGDQYGLTKVLGERQLAFICQTAGLSGVGLRLPYMANERSMGMFVGRRTMAEMGHRHGADEAFAWLHMHDAARLVEAILQADLPGFRTYLPAAEQPSVVDPIDAIVDQYYPNVELRRPIGEMTGLVDNRRITAETGWTPSVTAGAPV